LSANPQARSILTCENVLDCAVTNQGAADTAELCAMPAGFLALFASLQVLTKEGGTLTIDVGDGTNADAFLDGVDGNTGTPPVRYCSNATYANGTGDLDISSAAAQLFSIPGGKFYSTADTVDALINDAADAAKFRLTVLIWNVDGAGTTS
jgi:hypothetical protein